MKCQKDKFQLDEYVHYLNCAYKAPLLKAGEKALLDAVLKERNPFLYKPKDFFENTEIARVLFAEMIHAKPSQIALFPSTSFGFATSTLN